MRRTPSQPPELPGYTFVRLLGSGGFSDVFLYEQKLPKRRVAVKVLLTDQLSTATRSAFVDEANLMAQLSAHPYIVTIYQADVASDERPYFVMEYCSGPSLAERYKTSKLEVPDALRTGVRLSSAIATAHAAGILHRDIKPGNVLTNDYGWPALTDFGISSSVDDDLLPVHTGTLADALADASGGTTGSAAVGLSVPWSPPEMFEDDPQPDVRSDVFSLAATLYTVIAGHTPFEVRGRSNGTLDLIGRIERGAITPIDRTDLPRSLVAVLHKGMSPNRSDRFESAVEFARALQRVELELGYAPTTIDVPNLVVDAPEKGTDDDDATRARSVSTIEAQPAAAVPSAPVPDADATVLRAATPIDAQPAAADSTVLRPRTGASAWLDAAPAKPPPPIVDRPAATNPLARRNRVVAIVAGSLAAVVIIGIVVSLSLFGAPGSPAQSAGPSGGGGAVASSAPIPAPELQSSGPEGADYVFTVTNPDPQDGDQFVWQRTDPGADTSNRRSADGRLVVTGYTPGEEICIEASVVRRGRQGPNPLEQCTTG